MALTARQRELLEYLSCGGEIRADRFGKAWKIPSLEYCTIMAGNLIRKGYARKTPVLENNHRREFKIELHLDPDRILTDSQKKLLHDIKSNQVVIHNAASGTCRYACTRKLVSRDALVLRRYGLVRLMKMGHYLSRIVAV